MWTVNWLLESSVGGQWWLWEGQFQWRTEVLLEWVQSVVVLNTRWSGVNVEWGQGGWSRFRVDLEEKHEWRLKRDADQERMFYFRRREAACISIENALERNELVIQEIVENCWSEVHVWKRWAFDRHVGGLSSVTGRKEAYTAQIRLWKSLFELCVASGWSRTTSITARPGCLPLLASHTPEASWLARASCLRRLLFSLHLCGFYFGNVNQWSFPV